ncbi:hypothetical protein [Streptomyces albus]|uniref:hypothetical protein n=1 Tax=Streptomyces albus TaxID=1888 RepID=UPI0004C624E9|nr:hypothetical protein [Streptomyces albus]
MIGDETVPGAVLLLAAAPVGRSRLVDGASALPALAAVRPEVLTGTAAASVVELVEPADPQVVLVRLRSAAAAPGPLLIHLIGQLTLDRRQQLPHLALARTTAATARYTALPWHWLSAELQFRPPGTTTVLADLTADQAAWERLPPPSALAVAGAALYGAVSPPPGRRAPAEPLYSRAVAGLLRSATGRPSPAELHDLAVARAGLPAEARLLTPLTTGTAGSHPGLPGLPSGTDAPAVPRPVPAAPDSTARPSSPGLPAPPSSSGPAPAAPAPVPASGPESPLPEGAPPPGAQASPAPAGSAAPDGSAPGPAPASAHSTSAGTTPEPTSSVPGTAVAHGATAPHGRPPAGVPAPAGAPVPPAAPPTAAAVPPRPARPPEPAASTGASTAAAPRSAAASAPQDPHPAILAAAHEGRHGEAAAMAAAWEQHALRHHGPDSAEAVHWLEVRADLARLAGDFGRSCELWLTAASARLGAGEPEDGRDVVAAVDRAHHCWEQLGDDTAARSLVSRLATLRHRVPGPRPGAVEALERRIETLGAVGAN